MKKEEFFKAITVEPLAKTDDFEKFMQKIYLSALLKGGKRREPMNIYSVAKVSGPMFKMNMFKDAIKIEKLHKRKLMWEELQKAIEQGFWELESENTYFYDENGLEIWTEDMDKKTIISSEKTVTIKTKYYLEGKGNIKIMRWKDGKAKRSDKNKQGK